MVPPGEPERKFVAGDFDKCTGCGVCELVCALERENAFDPRRSSIKVLRLYQLINTPVACRLCDDAPCVPACPRDALRQSEENGIIVVDEDKCNGCGWCVEACDYGAIQLHPDTKVVFTCDLCDGEPSCVEWCPEEALDYTTKDIVSQKARIGAVKKLFQESLKGEK